MKKLILILLFLSGPAMARDLTSQEEVRYNDLGKEIRCVVCQSEPVSTSSAQIAIDMRQVIKDRIIAGDNDGQIRKYFAEHYGEYVLLRPQVNKVTYLLWLTPLLLLIIGLVFALKIFGRSNSNEIILDDDDIKQAEKLISEIEK